MQKKYLVLVLVILLAAVWGFFYFTKTPISPTSIKNIIGGSSTTKTSDVPIAAPLASPRTPPSGFTEYRNEFYRFQFFYPDTLTIKEYKEADSGRTITFLNSDGTNAFQIFIIPYGDDQITNERFKLDEPSGVRDNPTDMTVGGAAASGFYSTNTALGDTFEVWFLGRGFLYEATTYKESAADMTTLLQSWMFL